MPLRLDIAYSLITLMVLAMIAALVLYGRKRRDERRIRRGGRPRHR